MEEALVLVVVWCSEEVLEEEPRVVWFPEIKSGIKLWECG